MKVLPPLTVLEDRVCLGGVALDEIADRFGTPTYVYCLDTVGRQVEALRKAFPWPSLKIFYAMKSNWNPDLLRHLHRHDCGIDAVSEGDLLLAQQLGFTTDRILYTANNIRDDEMDRVAESGVLFNAGSLHRLERFAERHPGSRVCIRFNPDVEAGEHIIVRTGGPLSKFGILLEDVPRVQEIARRHGLKIVGIHEHTGSGIADLEKVMTSIRNLLAIAHSFEELEFIDIGGGFKVPYQPDESPIDYEHFGGRIVDLFAGFCRDYGRELELWLEPGKFLSAQCGVLLTEVNTLRNNRGMLFAGMDTGFSQLIRPVLYDAWHNLVKCSGLSAPSRRYQLVGNICEGGDVFGADRPLPELQPGDRVAIQNAGAYCSSMASVYNLRPLPAEVVIEAGRARLSRRRRSVAELVAGQLDGPC